MRSIECILDYVHSHVQNEVDFAFSPVKLCVCNSYTHKSMSILYTDSNNDDITLDLPFCVGEI